MTISSLNEMSADMGRKAVARAERRHGEKGIRLIGDMGFAMEEILFGGQRLFHRAPNDDFRYKVTSRFFALAHVLDPILFFLSRSKAFTYSNTT